MRLLFEGCVLDTEARQLLRDGAPVHLTRKAFELLKVLIERRPGVLSKPELRRRLWPDTHVLDANLPNLVAEVRTAIGDDAQRPRFVRTVHAFGYAFCGEVVELGVAASDSRERRYVYRLTWQGGLVALAEGEYLLGRHAQSIVSFGSKAISRRHARLRVFGGQALLEDLGSRHGTFVNGERLDAPARLTDGEEFQLASVRFRFRASPADASRSETGEL